MTASNIKTISNELKQSFQTIGMYNYPFSTTLNQRQTESIELSAIKKPSSFKDVCCYEVMDQNNYHSKDSLVRLFIDLEDNELNTTTIINMSEMYESLTQPLKTIINKQFKVCFSGYVKNENLQQQLISTLPEDKNFYYIISVNPNGNHNYSFHVIILDVLFEPDDIFTIYNSFKDLYIDSKYKPDFNAKNNSKESQRLLRLSLSSKQTSNKSPILDTGINLNENLKKKSVKTLLYYCSVSFFKKTNDFVKEYDISKIPSNLPKIPKVETKETKELKEDLKMLYNHDSNLFNKTHSIFDYLEVSGCFELQEKLFSKSVRKFIPMTKRDFLNEITLWYNHTKHTNFTTIDKFINFINKKLSPSVKCSDVSGLYSMIRFESQKKIMGDDLEIHNDIKLLLSFKNKLNKNIDLKMCEKKSIIRLCNKYYVECDEENVKDGEVNGPISELLTTIKSKAKRDSFYDSINLFELLCNKLDTLQNNFLKQRFCKFSNLSQSIEKYSCAYLKDINKYVMYLNDAAKVGGVELLKEYNLDDSLLYPKFESLTELTSKRNKYIAKRTIKKEHKILDVKKWLEVFKKTFKSEDMYNYYMSFFHYKLNGVRLNKNILNIGEKNCLKTAFVEYFQDFYDVSKATGEQFTGRFNGEILSHSLILIDEVQGLNPVEISKFIRNIKDYTSSKYASSERKGKDLTQIKSKFDFIINTNSDALPTKLLADNEAEPMLKRLKLIERVSLPDDVLANPEKFEIVENNLPYQYQLYHYIKKEFKPISLNDMKFDVKTEFEKFYVSISKPEIPKFPADFSTVFETLIKKEKGRNRFLIITKMMNNYVKTIDPDCDIFQDKKTMMIKFHKLDISLDKQGRLDLKAMDKFIKTFTQYENFDDFINKTNLIVETETTEE